MTEWHYREGEKFEGSPSKILADDRAEYVYVGTCHRCGGQGGWKHWPGFTCFRCGGNGKEPNPTTVKLYTLEKIEKLNATLEKRHARQAEKAEEKRQELLAAADDVKAAFKKDHPEVARILDGEVSGRFLEDIQEKYNAGHELSEKQIAAIPEAYERSLKWKAVDDRIKAFENAKGEQAMGRQDITAILLSTKPYDSQFGTTYKSLWITDNGYKIFGTTPRQVASDDRGRVFKFRATIEHKEDGFGFYKRPTAAEEA